MKQLFLIICFLSFSISSLAQTSGTVDIATFQAPKSWHKQVTQNSIQISIEDKASGTYCLITLFKSIPGTNDSKDNFDITWQTVVKGMVNVFIVTNTQAYQQNISDFLESISLKKPVGESGTAPVKNAPAAPSQAGLPAASANGYAFTTTNFDDGWLY